MSVKMFNGDKDFTKACERAKEVTGKTVLATRRQYKKWQRREGLAYMFGRETEKTATDES